MDCPICKAKLIKLFQGKIIGRYNIIYYKCNVCGLIKTEEPYWLEEAYSDAIADLDVGHVSRNMQLAPRICHIIEKYFDSDGIFLDYAGGYGLFVRMMRDAGFNYFREDKYCQNLFAKYFDITNCNSESKFELITAFEFLEHVVDPVNELEELLKRSDSILFTTELQPCDLSNIGDWWYFVPETGQHISFFSRETLLYISELLGASYYTDGKNLHLFTKKKFRSIDLAIDNESNFEFLHKAKSFLYSLIGVELIRKRKSLTWPDFHTIKNSKKT